MSSETNVEAIGQALADANAAITSASDADALRRIANEHSGKQSALVAIKSSLGAITDVEAR
jgi:hypothetical protein